MRIGFPSPQDFIAAGHARSLARGRQAATKAGEYTILMENPIQREEGHGMSVQDFYGQLALRTGYDTGIASNVSIRRSLFGKDAPRDHFTVTIASPNTPSPVYLARERTDSEKAVNGSEEATVKELAGQSPNDSSDELYRRETEAEGITNNSDRAFSGYFGGQFDKEDLDDSELWSLTASNRKEAEAMVEGLERAYGVVQIKF